uniref:Uncharacterized protein n=1 Tax=Physcomitrium patens TaxID=3218 RepID=A0A7I4EIP0_PHYPA
MAAKQGDFVEPSREAVAPEALPRLIFRKLGMPFSDQMMGFFHHPSFQWRYIQRSLDPLKFRRIDIYDCVPGFVLTSIVPCWRSCRRCTTM